MSEGFIPPHDCYRNLLSYRKAEIIYEATVFFCEHYIDKVAGQANHEVCKLPKNGAWITFENRKGGAGR